MKKRAAAVAESNPFAADCIRKGIILILFLVLVGCATIPTKTGTVGPEKTSPPGEAAVQDPHHRKEPADPGVAALAAVLKSKNIITAEEAARLTGQPGAEKIEKEKKEAPSFSPEWTDRVRYGGDIRLRSESDRMKTETSDPVTIRQEKAPLGGEPAAPQRKGSTDAEIAALVALLKRKNVISAEEASRLSASLPPVEPRPAAAAPAEINPPPPAPEASEQERIEKITARAVELAMMNLQEQVKKQVREELAREMKANEKEQIEAITASVTEEIKKGLPGHMKGDVRGELPAEMREKEETAKIAASITEEVKKDLQDQVKSQVQEEVAREIKEAKLTDSVLDWVKGHIRFSGDVRLRYQGEFYEDNNADFLKPSNPTELLNSQKDRHRFLLRARLGLTAQINDEFEAGVRISTGSTFNPVSTNVTLGDYENNKSIILDLGYLRWKTAAWEKTQNLSLWGGRIPNPFFHTDLVWDHDLTFDGMGMNFTYGLSNRSALFANALVSPLQEVEFASYDKWLFGAQLGFRDKPQTDLTYRIGAAYYHYRNITGEANSPLRPDEKNYSAPLFMQKGNTLFDIDPSAALRLALASEYRLVNLTGDFEIGFWKPVYITLLGDYVRNIGFDRQDVAYKTGNPSPGKEIDGYQIGLSVGHKPLRRFGDWELFFYYKYLGADAVLDAFTDSDFHAGGTNAKGWILGGSLAFHKNIWMRARWLTTDQISGPPLAIDTLQLELNARF